MQSNAWLTPQKISNKIKDTQFMCVEKVNYAHDKLFPGQTIFGGARNRLDTKVDVSSVK